MTTLASWAGVDSRGVASLYIVSDSRFTNAATGRVQTNEGQKIYTCAIEPHLFGFCGGVYFPAKAASSLVRKIDQGTFFGTTDNLAVRQEKVEDFLRNELNRIRKTPEGKFVTPFKLIHGSRSDSGLRARFGLWLIEWLAQDDWRARSIDMPENSRLLYEDGSGADALLVEHTNWQSSDVAKTSRAVFSAFCDALLVRKDPFSGGAPQLAGVFRKFGAKSFGIVYEKNRYYKGQSIGSRPLPANVDWFNEGFERADPLTMRRLQTPQRQPRPWRLGPHPRHLP